LEKVYKNIDMLIHKNKSKKNPSRVVILGAKGFVSGSVERRLLNMSTNIVSITRDNIDLTKLESQEKLSKILKPDDTLFFAAAKAPVKNENMLIQNLEMSKNVCEVLKTNPVSHLIYLSSDAVYSDSSYALTEKSNAQPGSLHGAMHLTREIMISQLTNIPQCFVRPTLIYGIDDPHNGYGPNRFVRLSRLNKDIELFGKGEEKRDHVWVEDVSKLISLICYHKSIGTLNIATGNLISFFDIANNIIVKSKCSSKIIYLPRNGPMPHNGYRPFDIKNTLNSFPDFNYTSFDKAILEIIKK
tara:strand:- start:198 stop:1097 length:900 start_codon:yes stop_codon:yes gene_type:complete